MTTARPADDRTSRSATGQAPGAGLFADFAGWLTAELAKPGFSMVRMLVATVACVTTLLVIEPLVS